MNLNVLIAVVEFLVSLNGYSLNGRNKAKIVACTLHSTSTRGTKTLTEAEEQQESRFQLKDYSRYADPVISAELPIGEGPECISSNQKFFDGTIKTTLQGV